MPSIQNALASLYRWAKYENFTGHDPHDLLAAPALRVIRSNTSSTITRGARLAALQLGRRSFLDLHTLFRVPTGENPKALALFLMGLLHAKHAATVSWEPDADLLAHRLLASIHADGGWGYPFPWQSRTHYLTQGTPNIVTTSFVGNALLEFYRYDPSPTLLEAIHKSANYIASLELSGSAHTPSSPTHAFAYAKNDPQIVFNASMLGAEFLLHAGTALNNSNYVELAHRAAEFVAAHQRADGGWQYGLEKSQQWADSFHTGFTIRAMDSIAQALGDEHLLESARCGFGYYRRTFLEPDCAIRYFPNRRYPIDSHALGEAMLTFEAFNEHETAERIAHWAIRQMRSPKEYFYYQRHRFVTNRIPYLRWSNAWMFRGMAEVVIGEQQAPNAQQ